MDITLRDYQNVAVNNIRLSYRNGKKAPLLVLPTGTGKTIVFSYVAAQAAVKGKRHLILVHRIELLKQTHDKLKRFGIKSGLVNPHFTPDYDLPIQVASVQTGIRRLSLIQKPDLIVIDEAHHAVAGTWRKIVEHFGDVFILGVTATPSRLDGTGLGVSRGGMFDDLITGPSIAELVAEGHLVKPVVYSPLERLDLKDVKMKMGDYDPHEIEAKVDKPQITGDVIQHYQKLCDGVPAVAFCASVQHARNVAERFRHAGYNAESIDGKMDDNTRSRILSGLETGDIQVVTSCDLISEGTDIPEIGAAILLRPTKSLGLYIQQVGRALRPSGKKKQAIILDHVGNVFTHGMPDDEHVWTLEGESRKRRKNFEKPISVRQCPSCYCCHAPVAVCPACGHVYVAGVDFIPEVEGELKEMSSEAILLLKKKKRIDVARARTLEDLIAIQKERGYKRGWAHRMFKIRNLKSRSATI